MFPSNDKRVERHTQIQTNRQTYMMLKRSFSVMPSRLLPMAITSRTRPQNTWTGRYEARNHDDATGNRKNSSPITH